MKQRAKSLYAITPLTLIFISIFTAFAMVLLPSQPAHALTKKAQQECRDKYHNKQLSADQFNRFKRDDCNADNGGNCTYTTSGNGGTTYYNIKCPIQTLEQLCYNQYNGRGQGTGVSNPLTAKEYNDYKKSDCAKQNGGPCQENSSSQGFLIHCDGGPDGDGPGDDSGDNGTTNIGQDYNKNDCTAGADNLTSENCEVLGTIVTITNVLTGLAATVIVAMIIWGGIQYSMAGADASKVQAAKQKITNALIALLLLIFGFSIIQWLVPGGLI